MFHLCQHTHCDISLYLLDKGVFVITTPINPDKQEHQYLNEQTRNKWNSSKQPFKQIDTAKHIQTHR